MKTNLLIGILMLIGLTVLGCSGISKDAEVSAFMTEFEKVTDDMVAKINSNPTAAGVDDAQKMLDGKKAALRKQFEGIKDAVGIQVSADTKKKFEDSMTKNGEKIAGLAGKVSDPAMAAKIQKLMKDYTDIIEMK